MSRILIVFVMALPMRVSCDGLPAPPQYDRAMLREYFGRSPAEVEDTFGKPSSVTRAGSQSPPENATAEEQMKFTQATESVIYVYSTVDGDLVFHFSLNDDVYAITDAGKTVSRPVPSASNPEKSAAPTSPATASLVDMNGGKHRLPQAEADFLAALVSARPDADTTDHISLDSPYRVIVDKVDLALEPDGLILMHRDGTRHWKSPGVRVRVLAAACINEDPT